MSKQVDERVVSMQFDNSHFEKNVQTTMSTLDKLKQKLNLQGASKGLENVDAAAKKVDISGISNGVETIRSKFSALEVMGVTALANITNSAVNAGKRLAASFTIEPIKTGFQEYETQINAVQTILANTQSKGTTLDQVNAALDELNQYADKTIYNFTEMTRNIGTFTAAGIDLDTSVNAIQGIANLAAVSGSTSQQASTAMYQLSQALASGTVKLMDWNSVVNAGMGGQVFQDALKETSKELGTGAEAAIKAKGSFRESLQTGWLTSEVLTETLKKFTTSGANEYVAKYTGLSKEAVQAALDNAEAQYGEADAVDKAAEALANKSGKNKDEIKQALEFARTAEDAATKVKTFTQLMDTLKEAAQSGWTQTWEILVGDFEEAKTLWTSVSDTLGDMINKSAEARNNMLEGWSKGGGRTMMIESLKNAFEGLMNIIKPIKEALREVFPPTTSEQLLKITERIRDLTAKFKELTEKYAPQIKSTFKGLFSIIKIGTTIIKSIVSGISQLIGKFAGLSGGILGITGSLGEWVSGVSKSITEANIFGKAINKIVEFLGKAIEKIKEFASYIKGKFKAPGFEEFSKVLTTIWGIIKKVGMAVINVASNIGKALGNAFRNGDIKSLLDIVNGGIITSILLSLKKWIKGFKEFAGSGKDILGGVKDVLDEVGNSLQAWQKNIKAGTLQKIAISIGILAAALWVLSGIYPEKLGSALGAITVLFIELMAAMKAFDKLGTSSKGAGKAATLMIGMSIAVLILASAVKKISDLDLENLAKGVAGVGILLAELVGAAKLMSMGGKKISKGATQMILMAVALKIMASVCKDLSSLSWGELAKGVSGIGGILFVFAGFAELIKLIKPNKLMSSALSLILIGAAMEIFADVCSKFGKMEWGELGKAGAAIAGILIIAAGFGKLSSYSGKMVRSSIALILIGAAMEIFADVCKKFGQMKLEELGKAGVAIGGILLIATGFTLLSGLSKKLMSSVVSLTIMAIAMEIFANVCKKFGQMEWEDLGKAGAAVGGILLLAAGFAILSRLAPSMMASAASLLIMAAALAIITPILKTLGEMSLGEIVKGLVAIAGAFAIIGVAGFVLGPIVPTILALSGAIALFGLGCLAAGVGIAAFAAGLMALSTLTAASAAAIVAAIYIIVVGILEMIPAIVNALTDAIVALCQVFIQSIPAICEAIKVLIVEVMGVIVECTPVIVDGILKLIVDLLDALVQYAPQIVNGLVTLIIGLLDALAGRMPEFLDSLVNFVVSLVNGLASRISEIIDAAVNLISAIFQGIADAMAPIVEGVLAPILEVFKNLIVGIVEAIAPYIPEICDCFTTITQVVSDAFVTIVNAIAPYIPEITSMIETITNAFVSIVEQISPIIDSITGLIKQLGDTITEILGGIGETVKDFGEAIKNSLEGVSEVFDSAFGGVADVINSVGDTIKKFLDGISGVIDSVGEAALNAGKGFNKLAEGVKTITELNLADMAASLGAVALGIGKIVKHSNGLAEAGKGMRQIANGTKMSASAFSAIEAGIASVTTKLLSIARSYYSLFYNAGSYVAQGFADGIKDNRYKAEAQARIMAQNAATAAEKALKINSPSKVFRSIAYSVPEGFAQGIDRRSWMVTDSVKSMSESAIDGTKKAISMIADGIVNGVDSQPTIRPVLDLSDVESGASTINGMFTSRTLKVNADSVGTISASMNRLQNGRNSDNVVSAINGLRKDISEMPRNTYSINGITYDDGSNISDAVKTLVRATRIERRT